MKKETEEILNGMDGLFEIGKMYYIFTVTYHHIGRVSRIWLAHNGDTMPACVELTDHYRVCIAGQQDTAVADICSGKSCPTNWERMPESSHSKIFIHAVTEVHSINTLRKH
jgi:hypothetical protein